MRGGAPGLAEPQNSGEAEAEGAPARYRASVMSAAKMMEKVPLKVPPHVSRMNEVKFVNCGE